jgi:exportin-2 (importin alpha re-exporter)
MLELHPANELPASYERMMVPLLHSSMWEQRGNVPALVRLWKAMLVRGASMVVEKGHLQGLLGIFQRLLVVKSTDVYAFDLLQSIYQCIPV